MNLEPLLAMYIITLHCEIHPVLCNDILPSSMSACVHVFVISANLVIAKDLDYLVKGCYSVVTG